MRQMKKTAHSRSREFMATAESPPPSVLANPSAKQTVKRPKVMLSSRSSRPDPYIPHTELKVGKQPISPQFTQNHNIRLHTSYSKIRPTSVSLTLQSVPLLRERLRNVRQHYQSLIEEQKRKSNERNEIIMGVIEEMQATHVGKMDELRKRVEQAEDEKKDHGLVDEKMGEIRRNIEELILQSNNLKQKNEELTRQILAKTTKNKAKEQQLQKIQQQVLQTRQQVQQHELNSLKNKKIDKQILQIFTTASSISSKN